jgi:hypothetical protein
MPTPNDEFSELATLTLEHRYKSIADNVSKHNDLLRKMKARGNIKTKSGGERIIMPLSYQDNQTYHRFDGYDVHTQQPSDVITSAEYEWRNVGIYVTASGTEIRKNSGPEQLADLVESRVDVAMATAENNFSIDLYGTGSLSNQIGGLGHIITADGTGTVGSINASTYTMWKNKFVEITGTGATYATLKEGLLKLWLQQTRGADKPDIVVMTHDFYTLYENGLSEYVRYSSADSIEAGSSTLKYKGADVVFDDNTNFGTTAELAYVLNTKYLHLIQHSEAKWTKQDKRVPINQDAVILPVYWMGQMVCNNRALQGRLMDAS